MAVGKNISLKNFLDSRVKEITGKFFAYNKNKSSNNYIFVEGTTHAGKTRIRVEFYNKNYEFANVDSENIDNIFANYRKVTPKELLALEKSKTTYEQELANKKDRPRIKPGDYSMDLGDYPERQAAVAEIFAEMQEENEKSIQEHDEAQRRAAARFVERAREARNKKPFYTTP